MHAGEPITATYRAGIYMAPDEARRVANLLSEILWPPAQAVGCFEADNGLWRVDAYFALPPDPILIGRFLKDHCGFEGDPHFEIETLGARDWVTASQTKRPPVMAGRFIIHGTHDRERVGRRRWAIEIEAGQAFGTGHHGSTTGCLIALDRLFSRRRFRRALDIGTGSGILAIAMARAGCRAVLASDSDPLAAAIARQTVGANGVAGRVAVLTATGLEHALIKARAPYDLVTANILARPLGELAGPIARHTRPGAVVVLSGLLAGQARQLTAHYRSHGLVLTGRVEIGEWTSLILTRH